MGDYLPITIFVLAVIGLAAFVTIALFDHRLKYRPALVYKKHGKLYAVCTALHYEQAKQSAPAGLQYVPVVGTVTFSLHPSFSPYVAEERDDLFVPYSGQGVISFKDQRVTYQFPEVGTLRLEQYIARNDDERLRFCRTYAKARSWFALARTVSLVLALLCGIVWCYVSYDEATERWRSQPAYATSFKEDGTLSVVQKTRGTIGVESFNDDEQYHAGELFRTKVISDPVNIGGGVVYFQARGQSDPIWLQGGTSLGLKRHSIVHYRVLRIRHGAAPAGLSLTPVSEREAATLLGTGRYKLVDLTKLSGPER